MGRIVVGVDGSPHAQRALRWALEEARLRGADVEVVHGYVPPESFYAPYSSLEWHHAQARLDKDARADAEHVVDALVADQLGGRPAAGVGIEQTTQPTRQPADLLVTVARDAELLVVGSRGRGGFAGLLLGSVSQQCVQHASCPVVVVPPEE